MTATNPYRKQADRDDLRTFAETRDPQAFERLTRRYIDIVYTFCRRQISDPATAEDITQGVFVLLAQKAGSLRRDVILSGWLFDAARYCCSNARRAESRRAFHEAEAAKLRGQAMTRSNATTDLEEYEFNAAIHDAMGRMKPRDREVVLLRYFEKRTHNELAEVLGVTEEAAKQRVKRALGKLRSILSKHQAATPASLAALPVWMESKAVIPAPPGLVEAAATALTAAGSTVQNIALDAAQSLGANLWIKLIIPLVSAALLTAIGAAILSQLGTPAPTPAASAPATTPSSRPASPNVAGGQVDLSSPVEALRSMSRSMQALDIASVKKTLSVSDDEPGRAILAGMEMEVAHARVEQAAQIAFNSPTGLFGMRYLASVQLAELALANIGPADVRIDGDNAIITMRCGDMLARQPDLIVWEGAPIHFTRDADGWKFEPVKTLATVFIDRQGRITPLEPTVCLNYFRALMSVAIQVAAAIETGQVTDLAAAKTMAEASTRRYEQEIVALVSSAGSISTIPRRLIETQLKK